MAIKILDGGLGTSLEDEHGVKFNSSMPLWSSHFLVTDPDVLLACQTNFGKAGVDVLLTPTYQVSISGFQKTKVDGFPDGIPKASIPGFLSRALDIAAKASAPSSADLALSLGPYGASMIPGQEYSGKYDADHDSEDALFRWHLERLEMFTSLGDKMDKISYVAMETLPRRDEIRAVRRAAHAAGLSHSKIWATCVFPAGSDTLPDGSSIDQVVETMLEDLEDGVSLWGIGMNCTKIQDLPRLVELFETAVSRLVPTGKQTPALVLYPDGTAGEVYNTTTQKWEKLSGTTSEQGLEPWDARLAAIVTKTQEKGVFTEFLVGGCCKASPTHIGKLRDRLQAA